MVTPSVQLEQLGLLTRTVSANIFTAVPQRVIEKFTLLRRVLGVYMPSSEEAGTKSTHIPHRVRIWCNLQKTIVHLKS